MATFRNFYLAVRVLLLSRILGPSNAFGAKLEQLHHRSAAHQVRGDLLVVTKASKSPSEEQRDNPKGDVKSSVEFLLYDFPPAAFESLDQFSLSYREDFDGTFTFLREQADALALEAFDESLELDDVCGDDCDECEIPEDWKLLSGPIAADQVMDFLGIARAKPLIVPSFSIHVWE